ncbi:MAG TPA: tRNA (adenosine(37)-N6)-dimethylallyltransferase MiaA [Candidatus Dormibacteraeota bacterium]|nr:tRNA (adenosine(37)-N6)-dimethylallyltransferase MiaA [Candidatus Dormibacteraeota bacterium]
MTAEKRRLHGHDAKGVFFIVGPTATGKSKVAADVAQEIGAEIISADAFQIYRGLDLLTAKPDLATLAKARHHLIGRVPLREEMNAEKFRCAASRVIGEIHSRGKLAIIVGGSGFYIKALTHGLTDFPEADSKLRAQLDQMSLEQLRHRLVDLDPETARKIDVKNKRRLVRAVEICLLTGKPVSSQRTQWRSVAGVDDHARPGSTMPATGVFIFRDRDELYTRINNRVKAMFENGVIEEVRTAGPTSSTAGQMIGLREIRQVLEGKMSILQCVAAIEQGTRRYAKRQLTWFRRQSNFQPLNLSLLSHNEAAKWILLRARCSFAHRND